MALGGVDPADGVSPEHFIAALSSSDDDIVFWSVVVLARLGAASRAAIPQLEEMGARHRAFGIRQAAVNALSRIAPGDPKVKPAIVAALQDESPFVRREALQALIVIPDLQLTDMHAIREMPAIRTRLSRGGQKSRSVTSEAGAAMPNRPLQSDGRVGRFAPSRARR